MLDIIEQIPKDMEENKNIALKNAANFGLILGLAIVIYTLTLNFLGLSQNQVAGFAQFIFMIVAVYIGTKTLRDKILGGFISYGKAVGQGFLIVIFASLIHSFFIYAFYAYISPESLQDIFIAMEEAMMESGSTDDEIEMAMKMIKAYTGPLSMAISTIFASAFWGLIIALASSFFLKREKNIFED